MTVREWFRVLRGELWRQDLTTTSTLARDVEAIARALTEDPARELEYHHVGPYYLVADVESYEARQRVLAQIEADMQRALMRYYPKDLTQ